MTTFTLPYELRQLAWSNQKTVYSLFFRCVASTFKDFGLHPKKLGAEVGLTMVLNTNNRKLIFHPHIQAVIPGGRIDRRQHQWKRTKGKYLFNAFALASVFRARFLAEFEIVGLSIPAITSGKWVVDCRHVGKGSSVLKYLSRYLYRGVLSEKILLQIRTVKWRSDMSRATRGKTDFAPWKAKIFYTSYYSTYCQEAAGESEITFSYMAMQRKYSVLFNYFYMWELIIQSLGQDPRLSAHCAKLPWSLSALGHFWTGQSERALRRRLSG